MDLAEFLLARIAEDEDVGRNAMHGCVEDVSDPPDVIHGPLCPGRLLAECAAKRRIVEAWQLREQGHPGAHTSDAELWPDGGEVMYGDDVCERCQEWWRDHPDVGLYTLLLLAAPYAAHPDYQPEWAPTVTV